MKVLKKIEYKQKLFYFIIWFLIFFNYMILDSLDSDNLWNFGASYSIANGLTPYKDFNLLTFPLSNFIAVLFMIIFGKKIIAYYIMCSLFLTFSLILILKLNKKIFLLILFLVLFFNFSSYNIISLFFCLLLMYLEKNNKGFKYHDFIMGLVTGLLIINKQSMVIFILPLIINKNFKQIIQSISGFLIPLFFLIIYLIINKNFINFINYTLLGVLDFGDQNGNFSFFTIIWFLMVIYNLYKYIKTSDLKWIYSGSFWILDVPLFDIKHTALSFIPTLTNITIEKHNLKKYNLLYNKTLIIFISILIINKIYINIKDTNYYINMDNDNVYFLAGYKKTLDKYLQVVDIYYNKYRKNYNVYFMDDIIYLYKLNNNIPINKFDMTLYGNNGYKGTEKLIAQIKNMPENTVFIVNRNQENSSQHNMKLYNYIVNNLKKIDSNRFSDVYKINYK